MYDEITEFREFYHTPVGKLVRNILNHHVVDFFNKSKSLNSGFFGFAAPLLDLKQKTVGIIAPWRGLDVWPPSGPSRVCLAHPANLPFPDVHFHRFMVVHALEFEDDPGFLLDEFWRILNGSGRLLIIVPNKRGIWSKSERTPFGHGKPYTGGQLRRLLKRHGFLTRKISRALFIPPIGNDRTLRFASAIEQVGSYLWPAMCGVFLVEAEKILYAPSDLKRSFGKRVSPTRTIARPVFPKV